MPISISCPSCNVKCKAPDKSAGRSVKCPKCGAAIGVPPADEQAQPRPLSQSEAGVAASASPVTSASGKLARETENPLHFDDEDVTPSVSKRKTVKPRSRFVRKPAVLISAAVGFVVLLAALILFVRSNSRRSERELQHQKDIEAILADTTTKQTEESVRKTREIIGGVWKTVGSSGEARKFFEEALSEWRMGTNGKHNISRPDPLWKLLEFNIVGVTEMGGNYVGTVNAHMQTYEGKNVTRQLQYRINKDGGPIYLIE